MASLAELTETTTFAEALGHDEFLFDRLSVQNPIFKKFARVLMRDDVAPRVALRDIANMAGVPSAYVMEIALGGRPANVRPTEDAAYRDSRGRSPTMFTAPTRAIDVRSDLENGHEPLGRILEALDALGPTEDLVVEATFHPIPYVDSLEAADLLPSRRCWMTSTGESVFAGKR